jgi:hypothetical protein
MQTKERANKAKHAQPRRRGASSDAIHRRLDALQAQLDELHAVVNNLLSATSCISAPVPDDVHQRALRLLEDLANS